MDSFVITVNSAALTARMSERSDRLGNFSPVMHDVALVLVGGIEEAFDNEADPNTGTPWQHLQTSTIRRREEKGYWPGKKLQQTGHLVSSFVPSSGPTWAAAGSNVVYAGTMNFGAARGAFGSTQHGVPIPWGSIPGRPFLGLSQTAEAEVLDLMARYLA